MFKTIYFSIILLTISFFSNAFSYSSSSYLIANSAVYFYDYNTASKYYESNIFSKFNIKDLEKKFIANVNSDNLSNSYYLAKKIIENDFYNQEAWLVYLSYAKIKNKLLLFDDFINSTNHKELKIVNFVFFNDKEEINSDEIISNSFYQIARNSIEPDNEQIINYDYLLFYLTMAINFDRKFNEAIFLTAQLYEKLNNFSKAEELYKQIDSDHSLFNESQIRMAFNKRKSGKKDDAEKILLKNLKKEKDNYFFNLALGDFYRVTKNYQKAIYYYTILIDDSSNQNEQLSKLFYARGISYERNDQWNMAEKDFLKSLKLNPEDPQVLNYLAYGWIDRDLFIEKSFEMLKLAYKRNPDSYYILDSLAWAYYKKNNLAKAAELMEEVTLQAPDEAISLDHLGDIYFSMGRKREAYYMWKQAIDLADDEDGILIKIKSKIKKYNAG